MQKILRLISALAIITILGSGVVLIRRLIILKSSRSLNLVLISIDTLRPDHMGVYGYDKNTTPNIDRWAKNSYVFTNIRSSTPFTYPSIASLMTGKDPLSSGITTNGISPLIDSKTNTIVSVLKKAGYSTSAFIANPFLSPKLTNLNHGFDIYKSFYDSQQWKIERSIYDSFFSGPIQWIEKNKSNHFFLWVHLLDPHFPYFPSKEAMCSLSNNFCKAVQDSKSILKDIGTTTNTNGCGMQKDERKINLFKALYDGDIVHADSLVKKLLEKIKTSGLEKNTVVVLYGDHGEGFDHDYYFTHGKVLYDSSVKIPLIIYHPLLNSLGKRVDRPYINSDIFPTILNLLGIPDVNLSIDGKSFINEFYSDILSLFSFKKPLPIFLQNNDLRKYAIVDGNYKYIYSLKNACLYRGQTEELYDLSKDPNEEKNIIKKGGELAKSMKRVLFDHLRKYNLPKKESEVKDTKIVNDEIMEKLKSLGY